MAKPPRPDLPAATVLLAAASTLARTVTARLLRRLGLAVLQAEDPDAAAAIAGGHPGPIDLLVVDASFGGTAGGDLAARLLAVRPGLKVLLVAGESFHE